MTTLHQNPLLSTGAPLQQASAAMILVHGRGASADSILSLADAFDRPDVAFLAPQATGNTWYPYSFLAPLAHNEPGLSAALAAVGEACARAASEGIPWERVVVLGFSQGACLSLEFAARNARRYGGIVGLSGGLIGNAERPHVDPPADKLFQYEGSLDGTPVFLGCSDVDPHIPVDRVHDSAAVFRALDAHVTERIYPGMPHTVNDDEIGFVRALLDTVAPLP